MIASFRDAWLRRFFMDDVRPRQIPATLSDRLFRKLQLLDDAVSDQDLRVPPGNHFERLKGNLSGFYSLRGNQQYRIIFQWDSDRGVASDIYLDPHNY